jgi:hypothetical protein
MSKHNNDTILDNIKARFKAKPYNIYKQEIVKKGNEGYFIYNDKIYFGNRFLFFFYSSQNSWFQNPIFKKTL